MKFIFEQYKILFKTNKYLPSFKKIYFSSARKKIYQRFFLKILQIFLLNLLKFM